MGRRRGTALLEDDRGSARRISTGRPRAAKPRLPPTGTFRTDIPGVEYGLLADALGFPIRQAQIAIEDCCLRGLPAPAFSYQLIPILIIGANVGMRQRDLAQVLGIVHSAVVALIDKLYAENLVRRATVPTDRRIYEIYLTKKGQETYEAFSALVRECDERFRSRLTPTECDRLMELLAKIAHFADD